MRELIAQKWPSRLALALIGIYQRAVSPWLPQACRFFPTCSEYAREVVSEYGVTRGLPKACARVLRCHPLHPGGVDLPD